MDKQNWLSKLWGSRKAMLAVIATAAVLIRELTGTDIPVERLLVELSPILAFIGFEGAADIVGRVRKLETKEEHVRP